MIPFDRKIVTSMPLTELWNECDGLVVTRLRSLSAEDLKELLRQGPVRFVVAEVGKKLQRKAETHCFEFWEKEVIPNLLPPDTSVVLEDFPGEYGYFASEWQFVNGSPIILLEEID
jgi:hypothetical protein